MSRPGCGEAEAAVKTGIVYALYLGGLVFGPLAIVGAALAYLDRTADERAPGHRRFQIRTAGIGMFQWAVGFVVLVLLIGFDSITSNPGLVLLLLSPAACLALLLWVQQYVWIALARLPQLGGHEDANSLNSLDRLPEGRHYKAANGEAAPCAVRRRSGVRVAAARSCRAVAAVARAPCSAGCGAAGRGAGRRWLADGRPPSGWWRRPQGWRVG